MYVYGIFRFTEVFCDTFNFRCNEARFPDEFARVAQAFPAQSSAAWPVIRTAMKSVLMRGVPTEPACILLLYPVLTGAGGAASAADGTGKGGMYTKKLWLYFRIF